MTARIDPRAAVHPEARLGKGVEVGAFAVVGPSVRLGEGCKVHPHAVLDGVLDAAEENEFCSFSVVGAAPQDRRHDGAPSRVVLGARNVVREHATLHGGTDGRATIVGDRNLFMVGSHVAHDVRVGSHCTLANGVQLAGHAAVEDYVTFGGLSGVAQFVRVGEGAFVAAGAMVERDVPPFVIVQGDRARVRALNVVGLRRRGTPEESVARLETVFRALHVGKRRADDARVTAHLHDPWVQRLVSAFEARR